MNLSPEIINILKHIIQVIVVYILLKNISNNEIQDKYICVYTVLIVYIYSFLENYCTKYNKENFNNTSNKNIENLANLTKLKEEQNKELEKLLENKLNSRKNLDNKMKLKLLGLDDSKTLKELGLTQKVLNRRYKKKIKKMTPAEIQEIVGLPKEVVGLRNNNNIDNSYEARLKRLREQKKKNNVFDMNNYFLTDKQKKEIEMQKKMTEKTLGDIDGDGNVDDLKSLNNENDIDDDESEDGMDSDDNDNDNGDGDGDGDGEDENNRFGDNDFGIDLSNDNNNKTIASTPTPTPDPEFIKKKKLYDEQGKLLDGSQTKGLSERQYIYKGVKTPDGKTIYQLVTEDELKKYDNPEENVHRLIDLHTIPDDEKQKLFDKEKVYGYSFLPPETWYDKPQRPLASCLTEKKCDPIPTLTNGVPYTALEWKDNIIRSDADKYVYPEFKNY